MHYALTAYYAGNPYFCLLLGLDNENMEYSAFLSSIYFLNLQSLISLSLSVT